MSGHSKWSTIKRQKGATDIKRGLTFTKIANLIAIAARAGNSGDVSANPRLRSALEAAREVNMPKSNIQRAIDRGLGNLPGQTIEEVNFEGFGPGKVAFFVEGITDNKLRTNQEIKNLFDRSGGHLGGQGSTAYLFDKMGEIKVISKGGGREEEELELIDLGALDLDEYTDVGIQKYLVYTEPQQLNEVSKKVAQSDFVVEEASQAMKPNTLIEISDQQTANRVLNFTEKLESHDDIQKVSANFNIGEAVSL